jgi:hypothetical protein
MRTTGYKRTEATQRQSRNRVRAEAVAFKDSVPLTQEELLKWWPFERLDPKRFPRAGRRGAVAPNDVEDALL